MALYTDTFGFFKINNTYLCFRLYIYCCVSVVGIKINVRILLKEKYNLSVKKIKKKYVSELDFYKTFFELHV